jgi:hypothetical protein
MTALLALLLAPPAAATAPSLDCASVPLRVPAEPDDVDRPRGFRWEGLRPIGQLPGGSVVLVRGSALEQLSRRSLRRQHEAGGPDRVIQVVVVKPGDKVKRVPTIPRGTLLEVAALPDGGLAIARTAPGGTAVELIGEDGTWRGTTALPENPQADRTWRRENTLEGGPPRLVGLSETRAIAWYQGRAIAMDLDAGSLLSNTEVWPLSLQAVFPRKGPGELLVVDRSRQLTWYDADLGKARSEACPECRVVALHDAVPLDKARAEKWRPTARPSRAAVVRRAGDALQFDYRGASAVAAEELPDPLTLPVTPPEDGVWAWWLRTGPWGTAAVSITEETGHTVHLVQPGADAPVFTWAAPEGSVPDGAHIVADAFGPLLRVRVIRGEGDEEELLTVGLVDPTSGRATDLSAPAALPAPLGPALSHPWHERVMPGAALVRVDGEPELDRIDPGEVQASYERCTVRIP